MEERMATGIFIDKGKGRAGDIVFLGNIEAFCQSLGKRCFAAAEITVQCKDNWLLERCAQNMAQALGFGNGMGRYLDVFVSHGQRVVVRYSELVIRKKI
jgi:hypothetical protein